MANKSFQKGLVVASLAGGVVGGGIPLLTSAEWDALTTPEKQAYGLVAVQRSPSGFIRGDLVYGGDYNDSLRYLPYSDASNIKCLATFDNFNSSSLTWGQGNTPINMSQYCTQYQSEQAVYFDAKTSQKNIYFSLGGEQTDFTVYVVAKCVLKTSGDHNICGSVYQMYYGRQTVIYSPSSDGSLWCSSTYGSDVDLINTAGDYVAIAMKSDNMHASWYAYNGNNRLNVSYNMHGTNFIFGANTEGANFNADLAVKFVGYSNVAESNEDILANLTNLATVYNLS